MALTRESQGTCTHKETCPIVTSPSQIPHGLAWDWT